MSIGCIKSWYRPQGQEQLFGERDVSVMGKVRWCCRHGGGDNQVYDMIRHLRRMRIFLAMWNLLVVFLMILYVQGGGIVVIPRFFGS